MMVDQHSQVRAISGEEAHLIVKPRFIPDNVRNEGDDDVKVEARASDDGSTVAEQESIHM